MNAIAYAALIIWGAVLSAIDIRTRRLPDALTLPGAAVLLTVAAVTGHGMPACGGALLLAVPYLLVHLIAPAACGAGDVKLALGTGAAAVCGGTQCWVWAALGAPLLTALAGAGLLAAGGFAPRSGGDVLPVPRIGALPGRTREPRGLPGREVRGRVASGPSEHVPPPAEHRAPRRPTDRRVPHGERSDRPDSTCARGVLAAPITVPHGPAMCLATVAALWPTV
ncbi:A24 family peptidase [Nocardia sp. NPDC052254]|uniref:A24 family peptidase n=1 Tax=Nocardia sp. NPDC052254 TaxID=3155681 RepID=UPI0034392C42